MLQDPPGCFSENDHLWGPSLVIVRSVVRGEARPFRVTGAVLAETPFWSDGRLHWADIERGEIHVSAPDGAVDGSDDRVLGFPSAVAAIQPAETGYVVALADRVVLADTDGRVVEELARVDLPREGMRLNEGKVDPQGRFFVGAMDGDEADAAWYRVGPGGAQVHLGGFAITNCLEWSLDGTVVYLADTAVKAIYRAAWDPETGPGELTPFRSGDSFDGGTLDAEGCLWTAVHGAGRVLRLDQDGRELESVDLPVPDVTGICFGGDDLSTLFVCSATEGMDEEQRRAAPLSGGVLAIDTAVQGRPVRRYIR